MIFPSSIQMNHKVGWRGTGITSGVVSPHYEHIRRVSTPGTFPRDEEHLGKLSVFPPQEPVSKLSCRDIIIHCCSASDAAAEEKKNSSKSTSVKSERAEPMF